MALIELNLEKPALKRVETGEAPTREERSVTVETETDSTETATETESESTEEEASSGRGRARRYGRRLAILGGTAAGVAAARKIRQRRNKSSEQQELEEDWQTAE
ncbi:hypothetical protein [Halorussus amylolyticus]|uniref:hypothetical protein n=1 Tax=Halorussus amylolyticus TaxID=1126242 RepID=UPI001044D4FE|nr:hypothetical protein [Halorussus amylolyticus]